MGYSANEVALRREGVSSSYRDLATLQSDISLLAKCVQLVVLLNPFYENQADPVSALLSETSDSVLSALESQQKQLKQTLAVVPQLRDEISRTLVQISEVREIVATLADSGRLIQSIFLDIQELQLRSKGESLSEPKRLLS